MTGKLFLVSVGPGFADLIPPRAEAAIKASDVIVGYELYLTWIAPWIAAKQIYALPLKQERERAWTAIQFARNGRTASLVSSGDVGVYGMAALVLELMSEEENFTLEIVPGISAASSCASLLGSPISHDYATLSLSDLLCPWEVIEDRARHLARGDFVVVLYNVQSKGRTEGVYRILEIFLEQKRGATLCGVVRNAYRPGQQHYICELGELLEQKFDMLTTVIIGNKFTYRKGEFLYTARGYGRYDGVGQSPKTSLTGIAGEAGFENAVWVFSGTSDGNALASRIAGSGFRVVVSTASKYGRELASMELPGIVVKSGRMGVAARRRELAERRAAAIVDATHPFAKEISLQLIGLAEELHIPYIRYERPVAQHLENAFVCENVQEAAAKAIGSARRIFLATGSNDLGKFLGCPGAAEREWFVRVAPEVESVERALALGIPRSRLLAMQGPFSREANEVLWRDWKIDCVVTKESGTAGGIEAKVEAADSLRILLIIIKRPPMNYPFVVNDFDSAIDALPKLK